jgi:signal peptidase I
VKRIVRRGAVIAIFVALLVGWAMFLRPPALGGGTSYVVVRGSSMLPLYTTGDLVLVREATTYSVGDVVAYRVPEGQIGAGHLVIHRIIGGDASGYLLQGDNNDSPDPWQPAAGDVAGKAWIAFPSLGTVLVVAHQPALLGALAAAITVVLLLSGGSKPPRRRSVRAAPATL